MNRVFKHTIVVGLFLFYSNCQYAQSLPNFDLIKLEKAPDYKPASPFALQTANYLLSTPIEKDNPDRLKSLQFLGKWMAGTPNFSFTIDETARKLMRNNNDLLGVYMASMVKYSLENKDSLKDSKVVKLNAVKMLIDYCENKNNNLGMTKSLKKLAEAKAKGQLEEAVAAL